MAKKYQQALQNNQIIQSKRLMQQQEIKSNLRILPELESLIPPLKPKEFEQLEANILQDGCREALLVWEQEQKNETEYVLIDGHNRYGICQKHKLDFRIQLLQFDSLKQVKDYMINNQLGRRNLTREQASFLRGMRYHNEKSERGKYDRNHKPQNEVYDLVKTSERLAEEYKVSKNTIERDAAFAIGLEKIGSVNPALKKEILAGRVKISKSQVQQLAKVKDLENLHTPEEIKDILQKKIPKKPPVSLPDKGIPQPNASAKQTSAIQNAKERLLVLSQQIQKEDKAAPLLDKLIQEAKRLKDLML